MLAFCWDWEGKQGIKFIYYHDANIADKIENQDQSNKRCIHLITLSNPLIVKNYLPVEVSVMIESGGVSHSMVLSEVGISIFHIFFMSV